MKKHVFTEFILYRYRYIIGYGLFAVALIGLLVMSGIAIPGMLTEAEMQSAIKSSQLQVTSLGTVTDLPYHLLQKASINVFGLTPIGVKLPSLLLAVFTGLGLMFLLRRWFKQNVAILASIIAVTAGQFLIIAQHGAPLVMLLFWPTLLLLLATYISAHPNRALAWKICFFTAAALSLYSPLSIYVLVAMLFAVLFHPHLRFMVLHMKRWKIITGAGIGLLLLIPLIWHVAHTPGQLFVLLGIPDNLSWQLVIENFKQLAKTFFAFTEPTIQGITLAPVYGFATTALMVLGLLKLAVDHHSARTYTIGLWVLILGVLLLLQPANIAITFVPLLLMLAVGVDTLFREWYGLFPRNPYARAAALVPLAILISGIVFTGLDRYINSYSHHPNLASHFSNDLSLVRSELKKDQAQMLIVSDAEKPFYDLLRNEYNNLQVVTSLRGQTQQPFIVSRSANIHYAQKVPQRIITNHFSHDNARFYIY